jgi:flagellar hook-basal body complex protein FliE
MRVEAIVPDAPVVRDDSASAPDFARALDALGKMLSGASGAEERFAYGNGSLQAAVYERAQADVAIAVATSSAQRVVQSVQSILNMQV